MTPWRLLAAATALCGGAAMPAFADVEARLSVSDFRVHLVDIDPADGLGPQLTWRDSRKANSTVAEAIFSVGRRFPEVIVDRIIDKAMFKPMGVSASTLRGQTWAEVVGNGPDAGTGFMAGGWLQANHRLTSGQGSAGATLASGFDTFVLSAGTTMTVTAQVDMFLKTTLGARVLKNGTLWREFAQASAYIELAEHPWGSGQRQGDSVSANVAALIAPGPKPGYTGRTLTVSRLLTSTLVNDTDEPMIGQLDLRGGLTMGAVSPVPEPGTAAMALAGVALLGVAARRRGRPVPAEPKP